jgi:hypothetical protein
MADYDDIDPDDYDSEDEYEDAVEELAAEEEAEAAYERERRGRRGGLKKLWADLTGATAFPGGPPEVSWPTDPDAWRAGPAAPLDAGLDAELPDLAGPAWGDGFSAVADVDAWRGSDEPREGESDEPGWP